MDNGHANNNHKKLSVILIILFTVIVGLIIAIVVQAVYVNNDTHEPETLSDEEQVYMINKDIQDKLGKSGYTTFDAINDYENGISSGSDRKRFYLAIKYADFVLSAKEDLNEAIEVMEKVHETVKDDSTEVRYYETLRDLCIRAHESSCANDYDNKITEIIDNSEEIKLEGIVTDEE